MRELSGIRDSFKFNGNNGSAGRAQTRTSWELELIAGIPFSRWGAQPFIVRPIAFPTALVEQLSKMPDNGHEPQPSIHPFILARSWQQELDNDSTLTKAKIAIREGVSRARVTQVMNLLQLPLDIQSYLLNPPQPITIADFSERRLRKLLANNNPTAQLDFWRTWLGELGIGNHQ